ncbi:MAG: flagellar export protein FliJ [Vicinamibacterales bacterium]
MRPFRFRAETVLDLRRREEEAARTALARARALVERAHGAVAAAREAVRAAGRAFDAAAAAGTPHGTLDWHRSWIVRLRADVQSALAVAAQADQAAGAAAVALNRAMQRRRVLERLRDRAWRRYVVARDRAHVQEMDQLASLRFAAQAQDSGGTRDDSTHQRLSRDERGRHREQD